VASRQPRSRQTNAPERVRKEGVFRTLGRGLITGAADDDPSAIGTYASAGAKFGLSLLWAALVTFPMMFVMVYLLSKVGQVAGQGLFQVIKKITRVGFYIPGSRVFSLATP